MGLCGGGGVGHGKICISIWQRIGGEGLIYSTRGLVGAGNLGSSGVCECGGV